MRAMDLCARDRLTTLLHADDLWLIASSAGELQRTLNIVVAWAAQHKARFHVTSDKTVVMSTCGVEPCRANSCIAACGLAQVAWSTLATRLGLQFGSVRSPGSRRSCNGPPSRLVFFWGHSLDHGP